jgi:hypothetical protein
MFIRREAFIPQKGERALIVGKTGSGKTSFACFLLEQVTESPIVIYDTKIEPKFTKLPKSRVATSIGEANEIMEDLATDYIVFRPPLDVASDPEAMDDLLMYHYSNWRGVGCYVDELYQLANNGRAGRGLTGVLTRGRSRGITCIMSTQRPSWVPRFAITEADKYYIFRLVDKQDRNRLGDVIPDFAKEEPAKPHWFYFYSAEMDRAHLSKPIKLQAGLDTGYTDNSEDVTAKARELLWI